MKVKFHDHEDDQTRLNSVHEDVESIHQVQAMLLLLDEVLKSDTFVAESVAGGDPPVKFFLDIPIRE